MKLDLSSMSTAQKSVLVLVGVLGPSILASYIPIVLRQRSSANNFDFWLGMPRPLLPLLYFLMLLAGGGFLAVITDYLQKQPVDGLFGKHPAVFPAVVGTILVSSLLWSFFVLGLSTASSNSRRKLFLILSSLTLAGTGIGAVLLLAGTAERPDPPALVLGGALAFALVTVLVDGVAWNARSIVQSLK